MQRHALIVLYKPYRPLDFTEDSCMEPVEGYPIGIPLPYFPSCAYLVFKSVARNFQLLYACRWLDSCDLIAFSIF